MPGKVKVRIISGRNLPVMDRSSDTTDAFVEIKLGTTTYKTDVCRKSLHPQWNSEWYKFEVDDAELQDEPLQIRLMDHDTYSANDAIGKVYLNLNPLLLPSAGQLVKGYNPDGTTNEITGKSVMSGWIPVYDTMHGIRGEVNITVKVELFSDCNRFRQSSCGVQFYCSHSVPQGYHAKVIHGFVEELIVHDDPEKQWIDKIRTPRASNEARQTLFFKLSGELQRKIGVKAIQVGGNAVVGYKQHFDLEGESGIVARGIGTAVTLMKTADYSVCNHVEDTAEERSNNYLKFVGCDKSFCLTSKQKKPSLLISLSNPITPFYSKVLEKSPKTGEKFTRHLSFNEHIRSSKSNPSLNEDTNKLKLLLKQEDKRGTTKGISHRLRKMKYSHNSLSKKMTALKAKLGDSIGEESEEITPFKATKKRSLFKRANNENNNSMAELLARSVLQAQNSLTCILEVQTTDSETETLDKLEPIANLISKTVSEPNASSDNNLSEKSYSSSESSSSDDDLGFNDTQDQNFDDFDTISNIVSNVEMIERSRNKHLKLQKQFSLPALGTMYDPLDLDGEKRNVFYFPGYEDDISLQDSVSISNFDLDSLISEDPMQDFRVSSSHENEYELPADEEEIEEVKEDQVIEVKDVKKDKVIEVDNVKKDKMVKVEDLKKGKVINIEDGTKKAATFNFDPEELDSSKIINNYSTDENLNDKSKADDDVVNNLKPCSPTQNKLVTERFTHSNIIIPPVMIGANLKPKSLVKTAMQTMLLEKVNIMGTYTPPTSPTLESTMSNNNLHSNIKSNPMFYSPFASNSNAAPRKNGKMVKSSTSASFSDYIRKNDTVLGVPFTHITNIKSELLKRQQSHPCLSSKDRAAQQETKRHVTTPVNVGRKERQNCFSDSEMHKPIIEAFMNEQVSKNRFKFLNLLKKTRSYESSLDESGKSDKEVHKHKRKFSLFSHNHKKRDKSMSEDIINKKKFHFIRRSRKSSENSEADNTEIKEHKSLIQKIFHKSEKHPQNTASCSVNPNPLTTNDTKPSQKSSDNTKIDTDVINQPANRNNISPAPEVPTGTINDHQSPEKVLHSPAKIDQFSISHRRSDLDPPITPKGNSLTGGDRSAEGTSSYLVRNTAILRSQVNQEHFEMLEYPFLTMSKFPNGLITQLGGAVSARSVKVLERITNVEEPESRDIWWSELRTEIRSHARSLNCNAVLGYSETTSICDDVCVLSASGTAAVISFMNNEDSNNQLMQKSLPTSTDKNYFERRIKDEKIKSDVHESPDHYLIQPNNCIITHLPYDKNIRADVIKCSICSKGNVPDVLFSTIEPPDNIPSVGRGCFIDSFVCRPLKDLRSELTAKDVSDGLPFLEYELHRLLVNKLKSKGMNAVFGLNIRISVGEKMLIGNATGTAVYLGSLSTPVVPQLVSDKDSTKLNDLQKLLNETVRKNMEIYQVKRHDDHPPLNVLSGNEDLEDDVSFLDLSFGSKDCSILEIDDPEDAEVVGLLMEERPPDGFHVVNTETIPGLVDLEIVKNLQMFTQIYRAKLVQPLNVNLHFRRLLQGVYFKLRRMIPCALCNLQFRVDLPESDEIQLYVIGMALGLGKPQKMLKPTDDDLIIKSDEDSIPENNVTSTSSNYLGPHSLKHKKKSKNQKSQSTKQKHIPYTEWHGVDITPLSYVPGGKIERYLGNLNFFFIRETTSIREEGGLSGFIHSFVTEVLAIVRAHVTALGGNALVAYFLTECVLNHSLHKNQGQCLINVGGDVVFVTYFNEENA